MFQTKDKAQRRPSQPEGEDAASDAPALASLPEEVLVNLLSFVSPWDLCSVSMVCRTLAVVSRDEALWRPFGHPDWAAHHVNEKGGWKGAYLLWLRSALQQYMKGPKEKPALARRPNDAYYNYLLKFLLVGAGDVGKSSLLLRFVDGNFTPSFIATIGIDFKVTTVDHKGQRVKMQIWDTAGQERFRTITNAYYRGAHGIYLVYAVSNRASFEEAEKYRQQIKAHAKEDVSILLIANKEDAEDRAVSEEEGRNLARSWGIPYFECSAKTGEGVREAFLAGVDLVLGSNWFDVMGMATPALMPDEATMKELAELAKSKLGSTRAQASDEHHQGSKKCLVQ